MSKSLLGITLLFLLLGIGSAPAARAASVPIDPRVIEDTRNGRLADFLVLFQQQAALAPESFPSSTSIQPVNLAYHSLQWAASTNQANALEVLQEIAQQPGIQLSYQPFWLVDAIAVHAGRSALEAMADLPGVLAIESDRPFLVKLESGDASGQAASGVEWNVNLVNAPALWARGDHGEGITIGIADTGVDWQHPALQPHYRGWDAQSQAADHNYNWHDAIHQPITSNTNNRCGYDLDAPCDDFGHGTHVTGTAVGDDGKGNQIGVAPGAQWIACRNMDNGTGRPSTYIECLQFLVAPTDLSGNNPKPELHADVINNSYSCPTSEGCTSTSLHTTVDQVRAAGIFMSVSAGNSGPGCGSISVPPAVEPGVFTVGATDQTKTIASFSSRGPIMFDGTSCLGPDLVAPGMNVRSSSLNGGYATLSGTSMAAPHVSGAVALLWSAYPDLKGNVTDSELILRASADHLTTAQTCGSDLPNSWPNNIYGYGFLNVEAAYLLRPFIQHFYFPQIFH